MDDELIPEKKWWKSWQWLLPLTALALMGISVILLISEVVTANNERENGIGFNHARWRSDSANRNKMLKDLVSNDKLKGLKKAEVITMLGQPDRMDNAYLFYQISQENIGFFPLHTTTLVIKLSDSSSIVEKVMIHE
jgi:hypothetical protein